jgi:hypothetical protein
MTREVAYSALDRNRPLTMLEIINGGTSEDEAIGNTLDVGQLVKTNLERISEQNALLQAHAARRASTH